MSLTCRPFRHLLLHNLEGEASEKNICEHFPVGNFFSDQPLHSIGKHWYICSPRRHQNILDHRQNVIGHRQRVIGLL